MKFAYYMHHKALLQFQQATTMQEKRAIALNYFQIDAPIVNREMERKLKEEQS